MIGDEFSESAKAVQEVAKTTKAGIEATEKLGGFVSRIINEPLNAVVGILTDKLQFVRYERQVRLVERTNEFILKRGIKEKLRIIPPKIALPVIEHASLEETDELQDLWASFIASSVDPNYSGTLRTAFIDIIKQLEVHDVHILDYIYTDYSDANESHRTRLMGWLKGSGAVNNLDPSKHSVSMELITRELGINEDLYKESIDNLIRVRCVAPYVNHMSVDVPSHENISIALRKKAITAIRPNRTERISYSVTHNYESVFITPLGISFVRACMPNKKE